MEVREIYCVGCEKYIHARLTDGEEIYPHRKDLKNLPFWRCDKCQNYVGCHHKNKEAPTQPLGYIVPKEVKKIRIRVHDKLDPLWKSGEISRAVLYRKLSSRLGWKYHTASIRSVEEGQNVLKEIDEIKKEKYG